MPAATATMQPLAKKNIRAALRGHVIVPMISPITPDGAPDLPATLRVADYILAGGCQGLLVGGTNGEGALLAPAHRVAQIEALAAHVGDRGVIYAGISSRVFATAVEIGQASLRAGAAAVIAHPPPSFIINATEIEAYYLRLIEAVGGPFFLYNMPAGTGVSIPLDVVQRLSEHPLVIGIKDSEGDSARLENLSAAHKNRADFTVFCGAMAHSARALVAGADGYVPSAGNLDPAACRRLVDLAPSFAPDALPPNKLENFFAAHSRVAAVSKVYQEGRRLPAQISALKACASLLGLCAPDVLPPLIATTPAERAVLRRRLDALNLTAV